MTVHAAVCKFCWTVTQQHNVFVLFLQKSETKNVFKLGKSTCCALTSLYTEVLLQNHFRKIPRYTVKKRLPLINFNSSVLTFVNMSSTESDLNLLCRPYSSAEPPVTCYMSSWSTLIIRNISIVYFFQMCRFKLCFKLISTFFRIADAAFFLMMAPVSLLSHLWKLQQATRSKCFKMWVIMRNPKAELKLHLIN